MYAAYCLNIVKDTIYLVTGLDFILYASQMTFQIDLTPLKEVLNRVSAYRLSQVLVSLIL